MTRSHSLLAALMPVLVWAWSPAPDVAEVDETPMHLASCRVDRGGCTMIYMQGGRTYGITAAHSVDTVGSRVGVYGKGETAIGRVEAKDESVDLALVSVRSGHFLNVIGVESGSWGNGTFTTINRRGTFDLKLSAVKELRFDKVNRKFYSRRVFKVKDGLCQGGDSGTGIFQGGKLVGVVTHGESKDDGKLAMSPTLSDMQSFIARNKKIFPAGGKPEGFADWGDKDRTKEILEIKKRLDELEAGKPASPGKAGERGPAGPAGPAGQQGPAADNTALIARIEELETWKRNFRAIVRVRVTPKE